MGVTREDLLKKLETIEKNISAKGHPMQDYSSLKMALLDLIEILKDMVKTSGERDD